MHLLCGVYEHPVAIRHLQFLQAADRGRQSFPLYLVDPEKVDFRHIDVESGGLQGLAGTEVRSR